jgi:hypothetical protein
MKVPVPPIFIATLVAVWLASISPPNTGLTMPLKTQAEAVALY